MTSASGQVVFNITHPVVLPAAVELPRGESSQEAAVIQPLTLEPVAETTQPSETVSPELPPESSPELPPESLPELLPESPPEKTQVVEEPSVETAETSPESEQMTEKLDVPIESTQIEPATSESVQEPAEQIITAGAQRLIEEPTVGELAAQLLTVSSRQLARGACAAAQETYAVAQRVAEFGWQQLNDQLHRRGIILEEKEEDHLKTTLLLLLMVVAAIFLLGMGKQKFSYHWELYYPN